MRLFSLPSLVSSLVVLVFGVYVYFRNPQNRLNRIFGVFSLIVFYWIFAEFMYRNTLSFAFADLWIKIGLSGAGWIGSMFLHFVLVFSGKGDFFKKKINLVLFYIPSVTITYYYSFTYLALAAPVFIKPYGWTLAFAKDLTLYVILDSYILGLAVVGEILCFITYLKTDDELKKQQAKFISIGWFIFLLPTIPTSLILPILSGGKPTPFFGTYGFVFTDLFMGYAISKYELFAVSPERAAQNIVSTMADSLVLMSPEGKILSANKATLDLLGYQEKELIDKDARMLFADKKILDFFLSKEWKIRHYQTKYETKSGKSVPILFSSSVIKDQLGNIAGIVGVGSDITERDIANTLQEALLQVPKEIKGIDFGYLYRSATEAAKVGGDFYDLFELNENKVGIVVGDISGKGIEAATLTSLVRNTIRAYAFLGESPASVMGRTNNVIKRASTPRTFVTVFFGILDTASGALVFCSAGHPLAMHKKAKEVKILPTSSTVIGVFPNQKYFDDFAKLSRGDNLIIYTDGITEARRNSELFGEERLVQVITELEVKTEKVPAVIFERVLEYARGQLGDDVVLLAVSLG